MTLPTEIETTVTTKKCYSVTIDRYKLKELVGAPPLATVTIEERHDSGDSMWGKIRISWEETETYDGD